MADDANADPLVVMRSQLLPALRSYHVDCIEVSFAIDSCGDCAVQGVQVRDEAGMRISRFTIPQGLMTNLEACVVKLLKNECGCAGEGLLAAHLVRGELMLEHLPCGSGQADICRSWRL